MSSEVDSLALIDMSHGVEEDAAFVTAGLFFGQTFAQCLKIFVHVVVMIEIQNRIETQGDKAYTADDHYAYKHFKQRKAFFSR